jgi:rhodanese-related sulfurtransferase
MTSTTLRPRSRVASVPAAPAPLSARHFLARLAFETDPSDLAADLAAGVPDLVVVDTRTPEAYAVTHIPGAVNLPHATIDDELAAALDANALYVTYCWGPACNASTKGAAALASLGFQVKELLGGLSAWQAEGFTVEGTDPTVTESDLACAC